MKEINNIEISDFMYCFARDIKMINHAETILININQHFTFKRKKDGPFITSTIILDEKNVGIIDVLSDNLDHIMFYSNYNNYAKLINEIFLILPKKGYHRILDWHTVDGFIHILGNEETVIYLKPVEITEEYLNKFISDNKLEAVEIKYKQIEKETLDQYAKNNK